MNDTFKNDLQRAIKSEIRRGRYRLQYLEIDKRGANEITIGFLEAVQEKQKERIEELEKKISFLNYKKKNGSITDIDIQKAKEVPLSTIITVPRSKKVLCYFHSDKVPSMHIYKTSYYCFSCGAHGDVISLVQKIYGLTFIEAIKKLI